MMPEAIAIVCAPKFDELVGYYVFKLCYQAYCLLGGIFVVQIYPGFSFKFLVLLRIIYVMLEHN